MNEDESKRRTRGLGLACIRLIKQTPRDLVTDALFRQLIRSSTSVGANYRAACRGRSPADVVAKLSIVEEECDETAYWLEILLETGYASPSIVSPILKEANEILAMTVASIRTMRARTTNPKSKI